MITAADDYPLADVLWTFVIFFCLMTVFWLVVTVLAHVFRRRDVSGWAKAGWVVLVLLLPVVGSIAYLVTQARAGGDLDRSVALAGRPRSDAPRAYTAVDEIARAKELLDGGAITEQEFEQLKRRVLV